MYHPAAGWIEFSTEFQLDNIIPKSNYTIGSNTLRTIGEVKIINMIILMIEPSCVAGAGPMA
jgi:hypothetical protein